jgi:hypothetical protein
MSLESIVGDYAKVWVRLPVNQVGGLKTPCITVEYGLAEVWVESVSTVMRSYADVFKTQTVDPAVKPWASTAERAIAY